MRGKLLIQVTTGAIAAMAGAVIGVQSHIASIESEGYTISPDARERLTAIALPCGYGAAMGTTISLCLTSILFRGEKTPAQQQNEAVRAYVNQKLASSADGELWVNVLAEMEANK